MLFNNLLTERRSSLIVKNSTFYIEIAKFVQAYTTIVKNPNEFLSEINENPIDERKQHLTWVQLVKIMQTCDFGFNSMPSRMDIAVYYNYALEIGTVDPIDKKIASVNEVAEAQKHYYNFVDEEKTNAETNYNRHKKILEARQREVNYVNGKISALRAKNWLFAIMLFASIVIGMVGAVGIFADVSFVNVIGKILPIWKPNYIGGIILIVLMFVMFWFFNKLFVESKLNLAKMNQASQTIFSREDELLNQEQILKKKLDEVLKDYDVIQSEIHDPNKTFDVKHNIDVLKTSNKYYQKLCSEDELLESVSKAKQVDSDEDFAPVKLSKEQEENLHTVKKEAIGLVGTIDMDAYNEKFEKSRKSEKQEESQDLKSAETQKQEDNQKEIENQKKLKEQQELLEKQKKEREDENLMNSIGYIKDLLGMNGSDNSKEK